MMGNGSGLMQRSFAELFARIDRMASSECIITCSYYELYNEQIIDLLDVRKEKKNLNIRQDVKRGVFVENLTEETAMGAEKLLECLATGQKNRHIGETQMNRESSRSHSIFTLSLAIKSEVEGRKVLKTPKLHFVDLAGSERQKMTMATGDRLKEAGNINKSLTTLGMVINALASEKPKVHIPYRDSKLTCLLRDSLGGNAKTFIVATISTSILCFQETLSTLNFANRAKMVKVKALVN
jgi:kinesin family protein 15